MRNIGARTTAYVSKCKQSCMAIFVGRLVQLPSFFLVYFCKKKPPCGLATACLFTIVYTTPPSSCLHTSNQLPSVLCYACCMHLCICIYSTKVELAKEGGTKCAQKTNHQHVKLPQPSLETGMCLGGWRQCRRLSVPSILCSPAPMMRNPSTRGTVTIRTIGKESCSASGSKPKQKDTLTHK